MEKENNPVITDLEAGEVSSAQSHQERKSPVSDIADAIETILSEEHADQKTKITNEQEEGLIGIDVIQAHMLKSFGYKYPSLTALKESKQEHALSVGGYRSEQIVDIFKSIQTNIVSADVPLANRLLGARRH